MEFNHIDDQIYGDLPLQKQKNSTDFAMGRNKSSQRVSPGPKEKVISVC